MQEISKNEGLIAQYEWIIQNAPIKTEELKKNEKELMKKGQDLERQLQCQQDEIDAIQQQVAQLESKREEALQVFTAEQEQLKQFKKQVREGRCVSGS